MVAISPVPPGNVPGVNVPPVGETSIQWLTSVMFAYSSTLVSMATTLGKTSTQNVAMQTAYNEAMKKLDPDSKTYAHDSQTLTNALSVFQERCKPTTTLMGQVSQANTSTLQSIAEMTTAMGDLIKKMFPG